MEDVSDPPFRRLCKAYGADVMYTEFVSCEAAIRQVKSEIAKFDICDSERPIAVQLYGSNPDSMERAAALAQEAAAPDFIDVNCGCWVKKIANRGDGAGLLKDLNRLRDVVAAVQRGTTLPVTVKARLGWDPGSIVILDLARILYDMGVQSLTVHCRTRSQGYTGKADWTWLPRIKEAVPALPLIANGDICTPVDAKACFDLGCDGVMIGRAAMLRPWVFRPMRHFLDHGELLPEPSLDELKEMCIVHLRAHVAFRGEPRGIFSFRRHYAGYLNGVKNVARLRRDLMTLEDLESIVARIREFEDDA